MELKEVMKFYKAAGFEVNDVRTEEKRAIEVARLRKEHGACLTVPGGTLDFVDGESVFLPDPVNPTTGTTEAPGGTVDPVQTEPEAEVTVSDTTKQDYFRGNAVIRVENRVQNGRVYKQVQTVTETYLVSEDEYVAGLTSK